MKKITTICTFTFMLFLSISFVSTAMYKFRYCNDAHNIAYGYVRSIDNSNSSIVQTWGECHQSNANVAVYLKNGSGVTVQSKTATLGKPHSRWAASSLIYLLIKGGISYEKIYLYPYNPLFFFYLFNKF